jgi:predicted Zn-dependent peptidase
MQFKKTILKNGLRIITAPMKDTSTVTVIVTAGVGSKYEAKNVNGISHFLEHMFFKGTKKRPRTKDISEALDSVGGEFNAFTGKEQTAYYAKVDAKHFDLALDVVSDIYLNSKIEEKEIERERGVIIQEMKMYEDTPIAIIGELFENLLYGDQPAGWEIIGSEENIKKIKRGDFLNHLKNFYTASNTVVCVAGDFEEKKAIGEIEKIFKKIENGKNAGKQKTIEKQSAPQIRIKKKKTDQAHIILGFRAYDLFHPDRYALTLLANILGGSMSSRLFLSVRERLGLAYYINASYENYSDTGYLGVKMGVDIDPKKIEKALQTVLKEIRKMRDKKVSDKELKKAKDNLKGRMALTLESSDEVASFLVSQELARKKIMRPYEITDQIDRVNSKDITRVAKDIFKKEKMNLAMIGPEDDKRILEKILKV